MRIPHKLLLITSFFFAAACGLFSQSVPSELASPQDEGVILPEQLPAETITPTAFPCPAATPEPLWVDPVISPTTLLTQTIVVYIGNGEWVSVSGESGVYTQTGDFGALNNPAAVEIDLLPDTRHHLEVAARVRQVQQGECVYGGYTLFTDRDRDGNPLAIDQASRHLFLPFAGRESAPVNP